jgi:hypothetical protein
MATGISSGSGIIATERDSKMASEVWDGMVPVQFDLDPREVTSLESPIPFFVSTPLLHE